ncbi:MAG: hypothetical protein NC432_06240 [Roseburia sp.]|nr:hypothetical protein [Roseburia sp.]MCM1097643.1 hypothetical protein [Ruminococcus flavefaciens]
MTVAEKFERLMSIIEYWTGNVTETDRYAGPFRYLREELWLREICVVPGVSVSIAQLKTFLASAVLEIYPWRNGSKISYRDIQKYLAGEEHCKKYSFFFGELEKCFSREENGRAAERTQLCGRSAGLMGDPEEKGSVSLYLLEKLQTMARIKIGEYWRMCDPDGAIPEAGAGETIKWKQKAVPLPKETDEGKSERDEEDEISARKQNKYMECLLTIALHEIFVRECERQYGLRRAEADVRQSSVGELRELLESLVDALAQESGAEARTCVESAEERVQGVIEYTQRLSKMVSLLNSYVEHVVGVEAEIILVMILEARNLADIKNDADLWQQMTEYLECMRDRCTENFVRYNKNRGRHYRQLEDDVERFFLRYMRQTGFAGKQSFAGAMRAYLEIAERGRPDGEGRRRLWEVQCVLVMPLWQG